MPVIGFLSSAVARRGIATILAAFRQGLKRSRLCRGPERGDRIPLGARANTIGCQHWRPIWFADRWP